MEQTRSAGRNQRMDLYRGAAIYGVVLLHVISPGGLASGIRALFRFGVPFFFLTAGYFSLNAAPKTLGRRAVRTGRLLLLSCLPYLLLGMWLAAKREESVLKWLGSLFRRGSLLELLAFQTVPLPYAWQLWFLGALFAVYLWWWAVTRGFLLAGRNIPYDGFAAGALVLLAVHLILGEGFALLKLEADTRILRSALLDGLPFFILGVWCAFRREALRRRKTPWHLLILGGGLLSLAECALAGQQEVYLGTLAVLAGMMGRCLRYRRAPAGRLSAALQYCGRELTLYIFAVHMLILALFREISWLSWLGGLPWLLLLAVAALSTLAALGLVRLKKFSSGRDA